MNHFVDMEPTLVREQESGSAEPAGKQVEEIRAQIDDTRAALVDKIETLQAKVWVTVEAVQGTVEKAVETVKETVRGTVTGVMRTFDVHYQAEQRPWVVFGASIGLGFLMGVLFSRRQPERAATFVAQPETAEQADNRTHGFAGRLGEQVQEFAGTAIKALGGIAHDWVMRNMQNIAQAFERSECPREANRPETAVAEQRRSDESENTKGVLIP